MQDSNEFTIMRELGEIKSLVSSTKTSVEDLRVEVLGPQGRLTQLEEEVKHTHRMQTYYNAFIVPLIGGAHALARFFGAKI